MNKNTSLRYIPFIGAGLVILTVLILTFIVIPSVILDKNPGATPDSAIFGIAVIIILHLLIVYAFREAIIVDKRGGRFKKTVFIVSGIGLTLLGLIIIDGASAYSGSDNMHVAGFLMFVCVVFDLIAAVLAFLGLFFRPNTSEK